jgi:WD40 repeat protein
MMDRPNEMIMKKLITWNVQTGELLQTPTGHEGWIWGVAFSPDGKLLASGGTDRTIILWDIHTNDPLGILEQTDSIYSTTNTLLVSVRVLERGWEGRAKTSEIILVTGSSVHVVSYDIRLLILSPLERWNLFGNVDAEVG